MKDRLRTVVSKVFDYKKMEYSWIEFHRQPGTKPAGGLGLGGVPL